MKANNPKSNSRKHATTTHHRFGWPCMRTREKIIDYMSAGYRWRQRPEPERQQQNSIQSSQTFYML